MEKILIIEEELLIAFGLRVLLQNKGLQVVGIARNLEEAEVVMKRVDPTLIFCGINISREEKVDIIGKLGNFGVNTIYLLALSIETIVDKINKCSKSTYLNKPYSEEEVLMALSYFDIKTLNRVPKLEN